MFRFIFTASQAALYGAKLNNYLNTYNISAENDTAQSADRRLRGIG